MRLTARDIFPSPDDPDAHRVSVEIRRETDRKDFALWFDVPGDCREQLSETGDPWLILMVPLALASGEDIALKFPVEPRLLENLQGMMRFWASWYPDLKPVRMEAPSRAESKHSADRRGLFFSGGADSTFTLLRHDSVATGCGSGPVDDLIFVAGLDVPISDPVEVDAAGSHLASVAARHRKRLLPVTTNLKQLDTPYVPNWLLFYGCALGAIGHLLAGRFSEILISAGMTYGNRPPTGAHPVTDPLLSSRGLRFVHDGAAFTRIEKLRRIADAGPPLDSLRVCWESRRHDNCSRCEKCLLTMVILDLAGFRGRAECFDWSGYSPDSLRSLLLENEVERIFFQELLVEARQCGRHDIETVVADLLDSSRRTLDIVGRVRGTPLLWRFDYQIMAYLKRQAARKRPPLNTRGSA
jgi:hypothetical protein